MTYVGKISSEPKDRFGINYHGFAGTQVNVYNQTIFTRLPYGHVASIPSIDN